MGPALHHSLRKFMLHGFVHLPTDFNCSNVLSVSNCNHITILYILSHTIPFSVFVQMANLSLTPFASNSSVHWCSIPPDVYPLQIPWFRDASSMLPCLQIRIRIALHPGPGFKSSSCILLWPSQKVEIKLTPASRLMIDVDSAATAALSECPCSSCRNDAKKVLKVLVNHGNSTNESVCAMLPDFASNKSHQTKITAT